MSNDLVFVLLPGFDGTGELFDALRAALGAGVVSSVVRYTGERTLADYVETVANALPRERVVLVAESFSGPIALSLLERYPSRIECAVLCATFATSPFRGLTRVARYAPEFLFALSAAHRSVLRHVCLNGEIDEGLLERAASVMRSVPAATIQRRLRVLSEIDMTRSLQRISVPVLYLRASQDRIVSERHSRRLTKALPRVVVQEIDGPHLLLQSRPEQCAVAITRFLATSVSGAR